MITEAYWIGFSAASRTVPSMAPSGIRSKSTPVLAWPSASGMGVPPATLQAGSQGMSWYSSSMWSSVSVVTK
jgi:hypothetical protein